VWAFGDSVPGPVLRMRRGSELKVRLQNALPQPVALHWHGLRGAGVADLVPGLSQGAVAPGANFDYRLRPLDAGTFWYRAHGLASWEMPHGLHGW
jgi:FtsP/CotA-like multicopper oxidase with cupredoxin domain